MKSKIEYRILLNSIKCKTCKEVLVSHHIHDFVWCNCLENTRVAVDGGIDYLKRVGFRDNYEELSVYDDGKHITRRNNMYWDRYFDKDMKRLPDVQWILIKDLKTEHIRNILKLPGLNDFCKKVMKHELKYHKNTSKKALNSWVKFVSLYDGCTTKKRYSYTFW